MKCDNLINTKGYNFTWLEGVVGLAGWFESHERC